MIPFRVVAIPTAVATAVRSTGKAPRYGHPAHTEIAAGHGPCRHCLQAFKVGEENRTLFTYDSFDGIEAVPLPGPVFVHEASCSRYPEDGGFPEDLRKYPALLLAYAKGRRFVAEASIDDQSQPKAIQELLTRSEVEYIQVHDLRAGCYDFRVERV